MTHSQESNRFFRRQPPDRMNLARWDQPGIAAQTHLVLLAARTVLTQPRHRKWVPHAKQGSRQCVWQLSQAGSCSWHSSSRMLRACQRPALKRHLESCESNHAARRHRLESTTGGPLPTLCTFVVEACRRRQHCRRSRDYQIERDRRRGGGGLVCPGDARPRGSSAEIARGLSSPTISIHQ